MQALSGKGLITPDAFKRCWQVTQTEQQQLNQLLPKQEGCWPLEQATRQLDKLRGVRR